MSFDNRESSRERGEPVTLYLFGSKPLNGLRDYPETIESLIRSVTIIPATTEFAYGTTEVFKDGQSENWLLSVQRSDFEVSLDQLLAACPNVQHVSLVVAWHGSDLRLDQCKIQPKVEYSDRVNTPYAWNVGGKVHADSPEVTRLPNGRPAVGGAPADRTVFEAIQMIKAKGLKVTMYPFILMDIAPGNGLPNPYGGSDQPAYPWRGRITVSPAPGLPGTPDKTAAAATAVGAFFGSVTTGNFSWNAAEKRVNYSGSGTDWGFRRLILHMATIAKAAGVDDFLIGSEMVGLTTVRSNANTFPAVARLKTLAADVRTILGAGPRISYAADWSEYHSYRPGDGTGDVYFHLDSLWSDANINFIGIDNYLPASDWRDGEAHLDWLAGYRSPYDRDYLMTHIEGGEYYDWYYADATARANQVRSPINDFTYGNKRIRQWWANAHRHRPGGVVSGSNTTWVAQSKPIVFTEIGCPAIDKGANQPNVFVDPKSSESFWPYFSNGRRDDLMLRSFHEAQLYYWHPDQGHNPVSTVYGKPMIEWDLISLWTWDARPFPTFPGEKDRFGDYLNWEKGHWLTGRIHQLAVTEQVTGVAGPFAYTNAEKPITYDGVVYNPLPIKRGNINSTGTLDKNNLRVTTVITAGVADLFRVYPPNAPVPLIIREGHFDDPDQEYLVAWTGRVLTSERKGSEVEFTCEPLTKSMLRSGLRRQYQRSCPHVLYGADCNASKRRATITRAVSSVNGNKITMGAGWNPQPYDTDWIGGIVEWKVDGRSFYRTILRVAGTLLTVAGPTDGLDAGDSLRVTLGCGHNTADCARLHDNILNYGGQPGIPTKNPINTNPFS